MLPDDLEDHNLNEVFPCRFAWQCLFSPARFQGVQRPRHARLIMSLSSSRYAINAASIVILLIKRSPWTA
jgi:hypothetical protein